MRENIPNLKPEDELNFALSLASETVNKDYLHKLSQESTQVVDFIKLYHEKNYKSIDKSVKLLKLTKFCYEKGEDILQKLSTVYNSIMSKNMNLVIVIDSKLNKPVDFYIGVASVDIPNFGKNIKVLDAAIDGNFTGTKFEGLDNSQINVDEIFNEIFKDANTIASVSTNSSLRDKTNTQEKDFVQGIEKFIDTMQGKFYTAMFIAQPISNNELSSIKYGFESLYTDLSQFAKTTSSYSINDSIAINKSISKGINESTSYARGNNKSISNSESEGIGHGGNFGAGLLNFNAGFNINENNSTSLGVVDGFSENIGKANAKIHMDTNGTTSSQSYGSNIQFESTNKSISNILKQIDNQLEKIETGSSYGLFKFAAYFISSSENNVTLASNTYKALMQGDGVKSDEIAVNFWRKSNIQKFNVLQEYLSRCMHPTFELKHTKGYFDATTFINGRQLPIHMGLPIKSVVGLPVVEHIRFGRSVTSNSNDNKFKLGNIFHMGKKDESLSVELNIDKLTAHTFITGSTDSGKSNTIYKILEELDKKGKKFLVIEPAKGHYKKYFGNKQNVTVYGTNPEYTKLLKINPFEFNPKIHVLEHIDRLIEIFNVCWPMYAAMPAILKDSIEKSYEVAGWDLQLSLCKFEHKIYPNFIDVLEQINKVINESNYSNDTKSDYIGSLSTRIKSLTNGIEGMIFTSNSLNDNDLFEQNVIIDLSRIGSTATKSLLMGMLVMKLSEYHMANDKETSTLQHITVLEEAHHLLKRTSFEQSSESSNLQGKSVEMLSNAIAEMRAYGEGFVISDQSPGLLDLSTIRNTNTKIILNLPDITDRELVGKASNLTNSQIIELSKLEQGVAAIYQNEWLEPVLCKVDKSELEKCDFIEREPIEHIYMKEQLIELVKSNKVEKGMQTPEKFYKSNIKSSIKTAFLKVQSGEADKSKLIYELFKCDDTFRYILIEMDEMQLVDEISKHTNPKITDYPQNCKNMIVYNLIKEENLLNSVYDIALERINKLF